MTTIGHRIAAACGDGTVGIYDSVTGVLRLSLNPVNVVEVMRGFPDGSILSCMHRDNPSITLWDIQTGGLIHTFTLEREPKDIAISLKGRYLACGSSDGRATFWEVTNKTEGRALDSGLPIAHLCWLVPEGQLMVAGGKSAKIWDVVTGRVLRYFKMKDPVHGVIYAQKSRRLVIMTRSGAESTINIVDPRGGEYWSIVDPQRGEYSNVVKLELPCFAFSQATEELVCGLKTNGLRSFNISAQRWRHFDHPATISSVSTLSNGTVVANAVSLGIQLLNVDGGYVTSRQFMATTLTVHPFDEGRIITLTPNKRGRFILLELATMSRVLTIPPQGSRVISTDRAIVLCASVKTNMAIHCFEERGKVNLQLWKLHYEHPIWAVEIDELPSIGRISPSGARLLTCHIMHDPEQMYICVWGAGNGRLLAKLLLDHPRPTRPLDITFDSENQFHSHLDTRRIRYDVVPSLKSRIPGHLIICRGRQPLVKQMREKQHSLNDSCEWVMNGSQRICWIPPGYIGSVGASYCWVGSSLVMVGRDIALRKLTFRED